MKLSQADMAKLLWLSPMTFYEYESGRRSIIGPVAALVLVIAADHARAAAQGDSPAGPTPREARARAGRSAKRGDR